MLQQEFKELRFKERPEIVRIVQWAAGNGDRSENGDYQYGKKRLREIDRRIEYLSKRFDNLEVVDPLIINDSKVRFGATVTIENEEGEQRTYSIVGIDETDAAKGKISWVSPLGKALLKCSEGDFVEYQTPKGQQGVEIIRIEYKEIV